MTGADWLMVCLYGALAVGLGRLTLRLCGLHERPLLDGVAVSYLCGQLALHVVTVSTALLPWRHGQLLWPLAALAAAALGHWLVRGRPRRRLLADCAWGLAGLLLCLLAYPAAFAVAHASAAVEWDARMIWMFHGKALFVHEGVSDAFFGEPRLWWSNLDYPLLLPAQAAWSALLVGRWDGVVCKAHLLLTFAAWFLLLSRTLAELGLGRMLAALLALWLLALGGHTQAVPYGYVSGMADRHYATPLLLAALALCGKDAAARMPFALLMLCYAGCVKNEATVYVGMGLGGIAVAWAVRHRGELRAAVAAALQQRGAWALWLALFVLPIVAWRLHSRGQAIPGGLKLGAQLGSMAQRALERGPLIATELAGRMAEAGAVAAALALLALALGGRLRHRQWGFGGGDALLLLGFAAVTGAIAAVFALTPHDVKLHMDMALPRLVLLPTLLLGGLVALRLRFVVQPRQLV